MQASEKLELLAESHQVIKDELLREIVKIVGADNILDTIRYYFPLHEIDPDCDYNGTNISGENRLALELIKVQRYLHNKKLRLQQAG